MDDEGLITIDIRGGEKAADLGPVPVERALPTEADSGEHEVEARVYADVQRGPEAGGYASPETDVDSEPGPGHDYVARG
ncbi:hypothetical protein [Streptomyces sp. NPDC091027]|uniref:hypothetical protein n=1 Tax=Streptomyces sp. NPDC091027 TaxID=3365971 RepID=UPI00381559A1